MSPSLTGQHLSLSWIREVAPFLGLRLGWVPVPFLALCQPRPGASSIRQVPCFLLFMEQEQVVVALHCPWPRGSSGSDPRLGTLGG